MPEMLKNLFTQRAWAELNLNSRNLALEFTFLTITLLLSNNNENFLNGILMFKSIIIANYMY